MSYCRFSECDVYAYDSSDGGVQFYVSGGRRGLDRLCATYNEAYQYAKALRDEHGLDVPSHAIEALKADALEEAARICGPDSAVAELECENAKPREQGARLFDKTLELGTENAKLRTFIGLKETCWKYVGWCDECPYNGVDDEHGDCNCTVQERINSLARELGVEVDE